MVADALSRKSLGALASITLMGVADARDCGTVWATVQRASSGYVREFSSYTVSIEQSDQVPIRPKKIPIFGKMAKR